MCREACLPAGAGISDGVAWGSLFMAFLAYASFAFGWFALVVTAISTLIRIFRRGPRLEIEKKARPWLILVVAAPVYFAAKYLREQASHLLLVFCVSTVLGVVFIAISLYGEKTTPRG